MIKKILTLCILPFLLSGCSKNEENVLKVAATPVPHAQLLEFIKPDLKEQGIDLKIIVTDDYNIPNRALAYKEIDANFFQHLPFLEEQIKQFHYSIQSFGAIEIEPMGIYSKKIKSLSDLKEHAIVALPNDPTNEGRALLLLENQGLIKLNAKNALQATVLNISANPKNLKFIEVDAAMLPRVLDDADIAAINTNYALAADFDPLQDALVLEDKDSPYANILAIRTGDEERTDLKALKSAMTSDKMRTFILTTYKGAILPSF